MPEPLGSTTDSRLAGPLTALLAADTHATRADALADLLRGLLAPRRRELRLRIMAQFTAARLEDDRSSGESPSSRDHTGMLDRRLSFALESLEKDPKQAAQVRAAIAKVLTEVDAVGFFADVGIPDGDGFIDELIQRLHRRLLPPPRNRHDLADLVRQVFTSEAAVARLQHQPAEVLDRLIALLGPSGADDGRLADGFAEAIRHLAIRVAGEASWPRIRCRLGTDHQAFQRQTRLAWAVADSWRAGAALNATEWHIAAHGCRAAINRVRNGLTETGVDLSVISALERIERCLSRLDRLIAVASAPAGLERADAVRRLLAHLAIRAWHDRSLVRLADDHLRHLHQRIVDRTGRLGEHYIAQDASDYRHIWFASIGGGLVTVLTAAGKIAIVALKGPVLLMGFIVGLNYSASFVLMQHLGLMLATKQPAMTAAALAGEMRRHDGDDRAQSMAALSARICSTQIAAAVANVSAVSFGALGFDQVYRLLTGHALVSAEKASHIVSSLSPFHSMTILYAALTGVILWASSVIGGLVDNWNAYHQVSAGLRDNTSGWRNRLGLSMDRNLAGWATNISLGMMLGLTPALGEALGIPLLEVRHVTLSTGSLVLAASAVGIEALSWSMVVCASLGIASMFVLNLGVSFALSLLTAARANGLTRDDLGAYVRALLSHAWRRPRDFLIPARIRSTENSSAPSSPA